ncbi:MAG: sigma-70 family RNA polymerase sigma factor [Planctomycetota bacterium]
MPDPKRSAEVERLLTHAEWVREVARTLVHGVSLADDVAQDAWAAALERPPASVDNARGWLRQVLLNRARQTGRAESRRRRREEAAARPEAQPSAAELEDRAARQAEVLRYVLDLEQPFREVVLLRFFEDLRPPEIATRLGVPLKTVHSRLQRAFDKLRARLDREYGDTRTWCAALAVLSAGREVAPAAAGGSVLSALGAWFVNANMKIAWVAAAVVACGVGVWQVGRGAPDAPASTPRGASPEAPLVAAEAPARDDSLAASAEASPARAEVQAAPVPTVEEEPVAPRPLIRGRALDTRGEPIADVAVVLEGESGSPRARTAGDGSFELELPLEEEDTLGFRGGTTCLGVDDTAWIALRRSCVRPGNLDLEHVVVAAPVVAREGWVQDSGGLPIEGARVRLSRLSEAYYGFPVALDMTQQVGIAATTDPSGRFAFARFPEAPGLRLNVFAEGYVSRSVDIDDAPWPLVIELLSVEETDKVFLEGVVLDSHGFAAEGATVRFGGEKTKAGPGGLFRLPIEYYNADTVLCAGREGSRPAVVRGFGAELERQGGAPEPIELVLGGEPLSIRGRVVDAAGEPCAGWSVSVVDETEISQFRIPIDTAEDLARGGKGEVKTDDDGRFELAGLFERDYVLQAFDRETLHRTEEAFAAGATDAVLVAPLDTRADLAGIVVGGDGEPLAGVRLRLAMDIVKTERGSSSISGASTVTDETGLFTFEDVPARYVYLRYSGEGVLPGAYVPEDVEDGERHEVRVRRRCHFRIELEGGASAADAAEFFDAAGTLLQVNRFEANAMSAYPSAPLRDGRSEVLSVSEDAVEVVLRRGADEVGRQRVDLRPTEVTVLRL